MLPAQEVANAISMVFPAIVTLQCALVHKHTLVTALLVGTTMHLPVSFAYHLLAALKRFPDRLDNDSDPLNNAFDQYLTIFDQHLTRTLLVCWINSTLLLRRDAWRIDQYSIRI